jgi:hypothetical protein
MKDNKLDNLLNAGKAAKGAALTTNKKAAKTSKLISGLDPEWEVKFNRDIKGITFDGTYSAFIRTCIAREINAQSKD